MAEIPLNHGRVALVDDEDVERLSPFRWRGMRRQDRYAYAITKIEGKTVLMHRLIVDAPRGMSVDHKNGDRLDNRKQNLRICTHAENMRNRVSARDGFKGVTLGRRQTIRPWNAKIRVNKKRYYLGAFKTEEDAARAYDAAAIQYHGEFALLNFPKDSHERGALPAPFPGEAAGAFIDDSLHPVFLPEIREQT